MITALPSSFLRQDKAIREKNPYALSDCAGYGPYDYVENSSKLDNLYDLINIKDKKAFSNGKESIIIVQEDSSHCYKPLFRVFSVDNKNNKNLIGTLMDNFHGRFDLFDGKGKEFSGVSYNHGSDKENSRRFWIKDNVMTAQVQDMRELKKVDVCGSGATIEHLNYDGPFNCLHRNIFDNIVDYVKGILAGGGDIDRDIIQNASKYTTFEDITPQALRKSGLLEKDKLKITKTNSLEINNGLLEGKVPLFKNLEELKTRIQSPFSLHPGSQWFRPDVTFHFSDGTKRIVESKPAMLDEQANIFVKAVTKYLSELNNLINSSNVDYLPLIKKMISRI